MDGVSAALRPPSLAEARLEHPPVDALVAIINSRVDFARARDEGWYRVPVAKAPSPLLAGQVRTTAFFLTRVFHDERWQVRWTALLLGSNVMLRRELLPREPNHRSAGEPYLRLTLGPLRPLPRPIPSRRLRRVVCIPTTSSKLQMAAEINDLFHASPIEDTLWQALKAEQIEAEREYFVPGDLNRRYALDFAIFGMQRNLDIECDGDTYHANPIRARYDNRRNNFLTSRGWSVLRFSAGQIRDELPEVMAQVRSAVKSCGGVANPQPAGVSADPSQLLWQPALWDSSLAVGQSVDPRKPARQRRRRTGR